MSYFDHLIARQWDTTAAHKIRRATKGSCEIIQRLRILEKLDFHQGCVNTLSWNQSGSLLLSGSDDHKLIISNPFNVTQVHEIHTSHRANIFSAKFLPDTADLKIVSSAGDGLVLYTDIIRQEETAHNTFTCHAGTVYELLTVPGDPNSYISCGEDGTVRWVDFRVKTSCSKVDCRDDVLIDFSKAVTSMSINPLFSHQLAVGCSDSNVRLFDRRMLGVRSSGEDKAGLNAMFARFSVPELAEKERRITSVSFRPDGQELLASYSSDYIYIFDPKETKCSDSGKRLCVGRSVRNKNGTRNRNKSPQPMKKLRLRGDWSDTGPNSRPDTEPRESASVETGGERESLQISLMQRMTEALSRMLNDPGTRLAMQRMQDRDPSEGDGHEVARDIRRQEDMSRDIRSSLNLEEGGGRARSESRAASAIQERWRRYRQLRDSGGTSGDDDTDMSTGGVTSSDDRINDIVNTGDSGSREHVVDNEDNLSDQRKDYVEEDEDNCSSLFCLKYSKVSPDSSDPRPPEEEDEEQRSDNNNIELQSINETDESCSNIDTLCNNENESQTVPIAIRSNRNLDETPTAASYSYEHQTIDQESEIDNHGHQTSYDAYTPLLYKDNRNIINHSIDHDQQEVDNTNTEVDETAENINDLESSYADLRDTTGVEPTLQLRYSDQGTSSSSISVSDVGEPLPGPSRVVTGPGQVAFCPVTGARRRRSGISSVPTSAILNEPPRSDLSVKKNYDIGDIIEYETEDTSDEEDGEGRLINQPPARKKFTGHRNARTMIKECAWWGNDYVMSGSDCGHLFVWDRDTTKLVNMLEADRHVVNCVQPHPTSPYLATSGIDYDVKIWAPIGEQPEFDSELADVVMRRNEVMLEETRDTITVPASLMIRMLASLNQIRRGQSRGGGLGPRRMEDSD